MEFKQKDLFGDGGTRTHNVHGVKRRMDKRGDAWATAHRCLPTIHMMDLDGIFGHMVFASNTGNRLFMEYVPDKYKNRGSRIRRFALVSLFDRKRTFEAATAYDNSVSLAFYLFLCRVFAYQPVRPRFFIVVGSEIYPPWSMHEVNIDTGNLTEEPCAVLPSNERPLWEAVWDKVGLFAARRQLQSWIESEPKGVGEQGLDDVF